MLSPVIDAYNDFVILSWNKILTQIEVVRSGKAFIESFYFSTIDPYLRIPYHAFKSKEDLFFVPFCRDEAFFLIPGWAEIVEFTFPI